jgi:aminoglycoside phosphotransferase (APT) family kinase protein
VSTRSLDLKPLRRGVTHDTRLVMRGGVPVAVLRLMPPGDVALPGLDVVAEAELLRGLVAPGVPRPALLEAGVWNGRPGLMLEYVRGETTGAWPEDALDVLLALHRAPVRAADVAARRPAAAVRDETARPGAAAGLDGSAHARIAALRGAVDGDILDALGARAPACPAATWVHGDFRPSNLVVRDGRIVAVLDWEMAGVGDPARDLGIATMPDWGPWRGDDELLARYRAGGGQEITVARLRWWRCLGYAMVVGFLNARRAAGWDGGPALDSFAAGLQRSFEEWQSCR